MTQVTWQVFVAMLLVIVTVIALLIRATSENPAGRTRALRVAAVAGGLAIFVLILGSTTIVSTRNIGVVTTFGRPGATLSNGLHIKAPWQSVTEMNGTIQIDNHTGEARHYGQAGQQFDRFRRRQRARAHPTRGRR
jgi:hypothetical protein